ncbi:hypothetical protein XENOCAPTIV_000854 [Xenoophorus captivus]|uniref:Uncharacterized protein n=1 Tax=Xenoophorus captivus TaxID=1517983 RepID=A0ABV0RXX9_9TELE
MSTECSVERVVKGVKGGGIKLNSLEIRSEPHHGKAGNPPDRRGLKGGRGGAKSYRFNDQYDTDFLPKNNEKKKKKASDQQQEGKLTWGEYITNFQFKSPSCRLTQIRNRR